MADHEREAARGGEVDQLAGLRRVRGPGLLDEDVLAGLERGFGEAVMRADGRGDEHGIDVRVGEDLVAPGGDGHGGVAGLSLLEGLRPGVAGSLPARRCRRAGAVPELQEVEVAERLGGGLDASLMVHFWREQPS